LPCFAALKISAPDLFQAIKTGDETGNSPMERKVRFLKDQIRWMVESAGESPAPLPYIWMPAPTYGKQDHGLMFAMCIQPKHPQQVTDLRTWIPPSCRTAMVVKLAIQSLLADTAISQKIWGRGVILYVGEPPKLR
jgi:hypothetical protein